MWCSQAVLARFAPSLLLPQDPQDYNSVFENTPLSKVMSRNPLSITPEAPLAEAVDLLYRNRLGCLPVLENGQLVGIITTADMLRALYDLITPTRPGS